MGTLTFSDAANMASPTIWYGSVYYADDNEIWLYSGTYGGVYLGSNFAYSNGAVIGVTLTSYIQARNITVDYFGNLTYTEMYRGEGFSLPAQTAYNYAQVATDASGFMRYAMPGADIVIGSAHSDVLAGFNSNDSLDGRGEMTLPFIQVSKTNTASQKMVIPTSSQTVFLTEMVLTHCLTLNL